MQLLRYLVLSLVTVLFTFALVKAQDPSFSQYKFNKLYFNPAYAGYNEEHHVSFAYRNLWPNVPGVPVAGPLANYQVAADFFILLFKNIWLKLCPFLFKFELLQITIYDRE